MHKGRHEETVDKFYMVVVSGLLLLDRSSRLQMHIPAWCNNTNDVTR
jgi:hypothetical protein